MLSCRPVQLLLVLTLVSFSCTSVKPATEPEQPEPEQPETEQGDGAENAASDDGVEAAEASKAEHRTIPVQTTDAEACEPLPDEEQRSDDEALTSEYEKFRSSARAQGTRTQASDTLITVYRVPKKYRGTCASWLDMPAPKSEGPDFEGDCTVELQRGGTVAIIYQTTFCGGDSCSIRYFVWDGSESSPVQLELGSDFSRLSVARSDDVVVFGEGVMPPGQRHTYRLDTTSGDVCLLTDQCFSPRVAPDGESVVCRNATADVLAVPLDGGEPRVIADVEVPDTHTVYVRPQWGDFPNEVRFLDDGKVEYENSLEAKPTGGGEVEQRVETFVWPSDAPSSSDAAN
jgi:hypothetical protein